MRDDFLPFFRPTIGEEEIDGVVETLRSGWVTTGPRTREFEGLFAQAIGAEAALAVNSGTAALHLALTAFAVGPGDRVYTTPLTFCSTVHVIDHVGATPVLVDVDRSTLNIDVDLLAQAVGEARPVPAPSNNDVILPVHLAGHPCDMDAILDLARTHDMAVVEDAAHCLPSEYGGRQIGGWDRPSEVRRAAAFSFYANKNMTTGEGGMLVADPSVVDVARVWSLHGMDRDAWRRYESNAPSFFDVTVAGFKYNMTDIQAAIGIGQLNRLRHFHARRMEIVNQYDAAFSGVEGIEVPTVRDGVVPAWHLYILRIDPALLSIDRDEFVAELKARNIGTSVHFTPIHILSYYRDRYDWKPHDFPVAYDEYQRVLSLPLYPKMDDGDVDDVIEAVIEVVSTHRR